VTALPVELPAAGPATPAPSRRRSYGSAWWGMATLIATEAMVFAVLLAAYFFLRAASKEWPIGGIEVPKLTLSLPFSFVLWGSSVPVFYAEAQLRNGHVGRFKAGVAVAFVMGLSFLGFALYDFHDLHFGWRDNAYGSIYYTIVGLHTIHLIVGLAMSVMIQIKAWTGRYDAGRKHASAEVFSLYWHFVDAVWLAVFPALFLSPHLR
jgi:heme/copper-type cytochrome/quinol oxidase subunit 3